MRAKNLRYLRNQFNEKQTELCKKLNIAQNTLSEYENGRRPIPDGIAQDLAYHYRISAYEFSNIDLSEFAFSFVPDKALLIQTMKAMYPIIAPSISCEDNLFCTGYKNLLSLQKQVALAQSVDQDEVLECLICFIDSWKENKDDASAANCISIILFLCSSYSGEKDEPYVSAVLNEKELDYIDAQKVVLRNRPDKDRLSELANNRLAFFHDYEDLVMMYIRQLKSSSNPEYRELADYYIACMQFVGFVDNDFDFETNQIIALHYLTLHHKLDNRYAIDFFSIFNEDIANSDI